MQVLITGADGFIGTSLTELLSKDDFNVIGVDIIGKKSIKCDIAKLGDVQNLFLHYSPDIIIHLAAISSTSQSYQKAILTQKINYMGTVNLLETAMKMNPKLEYFILASSAEVYGGLLPKEYHEDDLPHPLTPYASSKVAAESFVMMKIRESGLKACCIRFCNTFGRLNDNSYIIEYLFNSFLTKKSPIIYSPHSVREFMFLYDHLDIYKLVIRNNPIGIINASSGEACKILDLASEIKDITKSKNQINIESKHKKTEIVLNINKLRSLGFKPSYTLREGLLAFHKKLLMV